MNRLGGCDDHSHIFLIVSASVVHENGDSGWTGVMQTLFSEEDVMLNKARKRLVAWLLIGSLSLGSAGCYGKFPLTRTVYDLNGSLGGVAEQLVFWVFVFFPVYGAAAFIDAIVFNLIEFWTGGVIDVAAVTLDDGTQVVMEPTESEREVAIKIIRDGQTVTEHRLIRLSNSVCELRNPYGAVTGTLRIDENGQMIHGNEHGVTVARITPADLTGYLAQVH